jgi:predicted transcriptional regulator
MRTLKICIEPDTDAALARAGQAFVAAWKSAGYAGETISFESPAALFRLLSPTRWSVLSALQSRGNSGLRELARHMGRDPSSVLRDVNALMERGLIEKDEAGRLFVPYARIHTEFDLAKAA